MLFPFKPFFLILKYQNEAEDKNHTDGKELWKMFDKTFLVAGLINTCTSICITNNIYITKQN